MPRGRDRAPPRGGFGVDQGDWLVENAPDRSGLNPDSFPTGHEIPWQVALGEAVPPITLLVSVRAPQLDKLVP
jgi:hypothetical protein